MAKQVTHFKCLVVSPSDVEDARDAIVSALLDWNAHAGEGLDVKIEAVRWESHARPELGAGPQDIINRQIVDGCDFGIAAFWSRLGTSTASYPSGSVEEIERLLAKGANVMVYFCDAPVPQEALADDQYQRLQEVKAEFRKKGLLSHYSTIEELRRVLPLHVNGVVNGMLLQQRAAGQPIPSQGTVTAPVPDIRLTVASGLLHQGGRTFAGVLLEVQNHSPQDFFFSTLLFQLSNGHQVFFQRDFVTGANLAPRNIEPGNSFSFIVDPAELLEAVGDHQPTIVVAKDKIDRRFPSRDGELAAALRDAVDTMTKLKQPRES